MTCAASRSPIYRVPDFVNGDSFCDFHSVSTWYGTQFYQRTGRAEFEHRFAAREAKDLFSGPQGYVCQVLRSHDKNFGKGKK